MSTHLLAEDPCSHTLSSYPCGMKACLREQRGQGCLNTPRQQLLFTSSGQACSLHPCCAELKHSFCCCPQLDCVTHTVSSTYWFRDYFEPLCFLCPLQFSEGVVNLKFDEEPRYDAYMKLFEPLCGQAGPQRPIITEGAPKVSQGQGLIHCLHPVDTVLSPVNSTHGNSQCWMSSPSLDKLGLKQASAMALIQTSR